MTNEMHEASPAVVILCGGRGTRLGADTDVLPKPLVTVGGRPILWQIMSHYARFQRHPTVSQQSVDDVHAWGPKVLDTDSPRGLPCRPRLSTANPFLLAAAGCPSRS